MRFVSLIVALSIGLVALTGCGKTLSAQDLVGNWTGKLTMDDADILAQLKKTPGKSEKDLADAKSQLSKAPAVPLELKKDMTYTLGQGIGSAAGTWKFDAGKVTMTIATANGQKVEDLLKLVPPAQLAEVKESLKPMVFDVDKEGTGLTGPIPGGKGMKIAFSKPAPAK